MATGTKRHILVVDDDPDFLALLKTMFEAEGFMVTTASDGEEALSRVRATPPDLVTLDIQMPRKSGIIFYRHMRSDVGLRTIPVIVITGLRRLSDYAGPVIERFFQVDAQNVPEPEAYLDKPVELDRLMAIVNEKLGAAHSVLQGGACML